MADGKYIRESAWNGIRDLPAVTPYQWGRTVRPSVPRHWETWQQCLSKALLARKSLQHPLVSPLGPWCDSIRRWDWLFSESMGLFHRVGHIWDRHLPISSSTRSLRFSKTSTGCWTTDLPADARRESVKSLGDYFVLEGWGEETDPEPPSDPSIVHSWSRMEAECLDYHGWVPERMEIFGDEWELFGALLDNRLRVISDGSYDESVGTAAIQIVALGSSAKIVVKCQVPGLPTDQSPYRSELMGILAGVMVVDWLWLEWIPKKGTRKKLLRKPTVVFACDGKSALDKCFGSDTLSPFVPQFDVISTVRAMLHKTAVVFQPRHVKGHQDRKSTEPLTWWELRNLKVDDWAVDFQHSLPQYLAHDPPNTRFFLEPAAMFIDGIKQLSLKRELIQEIVALPDLRKRWRKYATISEAAEAELDWKTLSRAMKSSPAFLQRWISKHSTGICGVGRFMKEWKFESTDACPLCGEFEDHFHVPRCPDSRAKTEWDHQVSALSTWMVINKTSPALQQAILVILGGIRSDLGPLQFRSQAIQAAATSQLVIGSQGLLEGRLSKCWVPLQKAHYRSIGSKRSAHLWASRLSKQLMLIGYNLWTHRNSDESVQVRALHRQVDSGILSEFAMGTNGLPRIIKPKLKG